MTQPPRAGRRQVAAANDFTRAALEPVRDFTLPCGMCGVRIPVIHRVMACPGCGETVQLKGSILADMDLDDE